MKIQLTRNTNGIFLPSTDRDRDLLKHVKQGDTIEADFRKPRNPGHHRKYFAMLNLVVSSLPDTLSLQFGTIDLLRDEIMLQTGRYDLRSSIDPSGTITAWRKPHSLSFSSMSQTAFESVYSESIDICLRLFVPEDDRDRVENEIINFV